VLNVPSLLPPLTSLGSNIGYGSGRVAADDAEPAWPVVGQPAADG
jgi:hypothetical protein